jgi:solute carrier family 45 protein 1/2/4
MGAFGVSVSILSLAWAGGTGHWAAALFFPAERIEAAGTITRICAVLSICMLGLAVQPLQCGLRALVLDLCPAEQQVRAQAWAVRFSGMGQILGCAAGVLGVPSTSSLGGLWTFRILSVVAILAVNITAIVTCLGVQEPSRLRLHHRQRSHHSPLHDILRSLIRTFIEASPLIRRVLSVQILAWMGWFTFLFYNTRFVRLFKLSFTDKTQS